MRVSVNAAMSADGKLSTRRREQVAISGDEDFARVDRLRAEADAVVVGIGTVLADDPSLTRHDAAHRHEVKGDAPPPARVVVDSRCRTPTDATVIRGDRDTYVLAAESAGAEDRDALETAGAEVLVAGESQVDLPAALDALESRGIENIVVEGGGELIFGLFEARLVDELTVFVGPVVIGGADAPTLADGPGFVDHEAFPELALTGTQELDGGIVLSWDVV